MHSKLLFVGILILFMINFVITECAGSPDSPVSGEQTYPILKANVEETNHSSNNDVNSESNSSLARDLHSPSELLPQAKLLEPRPSIQSILEAYPLMEVEKSMRKRNRFPACSIS